MAVVEELIRVENENGLSFGDYTVGLMVFSAFFFG